MKKKYQLGTKLWRYAVMARRHHETKCDGFRKSSTHPTGWSLDAPIWTDDNLHHLPRLAVGFGFPAMIEYRNRTFRKLYDRGDALVLENMHFESCMFESCALSRTKDVHRRSTVRNVSIKNCAANGCGVGPAIFDNVEIDGLATNDLLIVWAASFKHVKFSGDIGKIKINSWAHFVDRTEETQGPFSQARETFYRCIDWALDISEARFKGFDATGIPARLFRRDPETQAVVTRERVAAEDGQRIARADDNPWLPWVRGALSDGSSDGVLVTPLGAPKKKRDEFLQGLKQLRALGIAELD